MSKHPLYDTAVKEVRGEASSKEKVVLQADVTAWRDALQSVIDEVDAQMIVETDQFEDSTRNLSEGSSEYRLAEESFETWKSRVKVFKKHISARLLAVKRMCQEEAEEVGDRQLRARVIAAAVALQAADQPPVDPDEYDKRYDDLLDAVDALLDSES